MRRLWAGGVHSQGVVVEGVIEVKAKPPEIYENGGKTGGFMHFWLINRRKRGFSLKST